MRHIFILIMLITNSAASNACDCFRRSKKTKPTIAVQARPVQPMAFQKSEYHSSLPVVAAKVVSQQDDPLRFLTVPKQIGTPTPGHDSDSDDSKGLPFARSSISPAAAASTKVSLGVSRPSQSSYLSDELVSPAAITAQCAEKVLSPLPEKPDAQSLKSEKSLSRATQVLSPSVRGQEEADARPIIQSSEPDAASEQLPVSRIIFVGKEVVSLATETSLTMVRVKPQPQKKPEKKRAVDPDSPQEGGKSLLDFQGVISNERAEWEKRMKQEALALGKTFDEILDEKRALQVLLDGPHPCKLPARVRNRIKPDPRAIPPIRQIEKI